MSLKIVVAGILAIPCLLLVIVTAPLVAVLSLPAAWLLLFHKPTIDYKALPDQVIIAGGSSGIGLSIAHECVRRGVPKITLLARNATKLQAAKKALEEKAGDTSKIHTVSVSVSDFDALEKCATSLKIPKNDRVVLFNCAGISYTTEFEKIPPVQLETLVQTNQLGAMYIVRAFLPFLTKGCIVLTASVAGQLGVYGYVAYSPTKYALRGFAETLHMELIRTHPELHIQIAFPADTNTPGHEEELKMMPAITKKINDTAGLAHPDDTAKTMVSAAFTEHPKFAVYFGLEGWYVNGMTAGVSPLTNLPDALTQVALSGVFRLISLFFVNDWWNIVRNHKDEVSSADSGEKKTNIS